MSPLRTSRYHLFLESGSTQAFTTWVHERLTKWARENGFSSDPTLWHGVQVRTQAEANSAALICLGQDAFDVWLAGRQHGST